MREEGATHEALRLNDFDECIDRRGSRSKLDKDGKSVCLVFAKEKRRKAK